MWILRTGRHVVNSDLQLEHCADPCLMTEDSYPESNERRHCNLGQGRERRGEESERDRRGDKPLPATKY